ncbi:MAG: pilus assembly protein [Alphaproteobacteria bacterium]|nr:pilus assembly protein [Alphaproteobacteria bacterium]
MKTSRIRRLLRDRCGTAAVEFALLFPVVALLTFGIIELSLIGYDYHRLGEATRRGAREAVISPLVPSLTGFSGGSIACTGGAGGGVSCTGAAVSSASTMSDILALMQQVVPEITLENLEIRYEDSGLSPPEAPGIITLLITVRLVGVTHDYFFLNTIAGFSTSLAFPDFATTILSPKLISG